jgi:hypothetical protein
MNELLGRILDAHGGLDRWNGYEKVDATIVSGGGFFALKGVLQDSNPRPPLKESLAGFANRKHRPTVSRSIPS